MKIIPPQSVITIGLLAAIFGLAILPGTARPEEPSEERIRELESKVDQLQQRLADLEKLLRRQARETEPGDEAEAAVAEKAPRALEEAAAEEIRPRREDVEAARAVPTVADRAVAERVAIPGEEDGPVLEVTRIELAYAREHEGQPPIEAFADTRIRLGVTPTGGNVAPKPNRRTRDIALDRVGSLRDPEFYASAIGHIGGAIVSRFNDLGLMGVWVTPDPSQIDPRTGEDLRGEDETTLRLLVHTSPLEEVRTLASGDRISSEERVNHPAHDRILAHSPLVGAGPDREGDLVNKKKIDRYVKWLSRHPGRRVDVSVAPAADGGVALDYLIQENKPWTAYFRIANDGTEQTDEWRQTFGFIHNQLTGADDILGLTYSTTAFDEVHAFNGSYERPFEANPRWRWRVRGAYSEFDASTLGFAGLDFEGESFRIGGDLEWNFFQEGDLFADLVAGVTVHRSEVDNPGLAVEGKGTFVVPSLGLAMERQRRFDNLWGSLTLQANLRDNDTEALNALGRFDPDDRFVMLSYDLGHSVYLDPLIHGDAWHEPSTPETSTLAHELVMSLRGQTSLGNRLTPQYQMTVGGMHTVRGYEESTISGDSVVMGTLEYRLHVPRLFPVQEEAGEVFGRPFRWSPQQAYGAPDWDLVLRGFLDAAHVGFTDETSFEENETLVGLGFGAGIRLKRNVSVDVDWGFALSETEDESTTRGSSQVHISATVLY